MFALSFGASAHREEEMARKTIFVSDLTGEEIRDGEGATLSITYQDARRGVVRLDVNANEVDDLARARSRLGAAGDQSRRRLNLSLAVNPLSQPQSQPRARPTKKRSAKVATAAKMKPTNFPDDPACGGEGYPTVDRREH
jgi:hypothetical protein